MARSVEADRLRSAMDAADAERQRWARELHDETLQGLGGLRVLLASALSRGEPEQNETAMREAIEEIETAIGNLRGIISDLRPSALDDLGLRAALSALIKRRGADDLEVLSELNLPDPRAGEARLSPELETTVYRLAQEAVTNVVKHAKASRLKLSVTAVDDCVLIEVADDGIGFSADAKTAGFGLAGMRERVYLAGGILDVESASETGTVLSARLPIRSRAEAHHPSEHRQVAS
jgi:signal transduction histidine kinase